MSWVARQVLAAPSWQALDSPVIAADCLDALRTLPDASVDAVVTDPPYGLSREPDMREVLDHWLAGDDFVHRGGGFMGQSWDSLVPGPSVWREAHRVLKPGGYLLAFGGSRTYDLLVLAIRLAGFEVRDTIAWMYGNGFPKSLDVSKAIDRAAGAERPGYSLAENRDNRTLDGGFTDAEAARAITAPATPEAAAWEGWGTALKPAFEPVVVARKPLAGTVAANVLEHGTGALNIDACRIGDNAGWSYPKGRGGQGWHGRESLARNLKEPIAAQAGRWPANVVLDEGAADLLDEQTGELRSGANPTRRSTDKFRSVYGDFAGHAECIPARGADAGGASRFFYCAKASRRERSAGLEHLPRGPLRWSSGDANAGSFQSAGTDRTAHNHHPTVKPIALMRWLLRLVTPPGGLVLDPFAGSGTTVCAGAVEGITVVGIERERDYAEIARQRVAWWAEHGDAAIERARDRRRAAPAREELRMEMIDDSWATVRVVHEPGCGGVCGDGCEREVLA